MSELNLPPLAFRRPSRRGGGFTIETAAPEQIMSALYYEMYVADETLRGAAMNSWMEGAFKRVSDDFGDWLDHRATANPSELKHVYSWGGVGNPSQRLFQLSRGPVVDQTFKLSYKFLPERKLTPIDPRLLIPNPITGKVVTKTYVFRQKAKIMESGLPVVVRPRGSNWLAVPVAGGKFRGRTNSRGLDERGVGIAFSRGPLIIRDVGGKQATGGFGRNFKVYFTSGLATKRLKASGYLNKPQKVAKIAGENIPAQIRRAGFKGGINEGAIKRWAKMEVDQAAKIYD